MEKITRIFKGFLISLMLFGILTAAGALLLKLTPFPESWSFFYLLTAMALVCFFGGFYLSGYFQKAGILIGLISSAVLILLILAIVSACFSKIITLAVFTPLYFIPMAAGIIGGIAGANMKK